MNSAYTVPLFLRGELITDDLVSFGTRTGGNQFQAPDMARYVDRLPLATPMAMTDLNDLAFDEILDVLEALGDALDFDRNTHLQEAYEAALSANPLPAEMLKNSYQILRPLFSRANVLEVADTQVGLGLSQRLGAAEAGRRTGIAGPRLRSAGPAHPGGQRWSCFGGDDPAIGDHPLRHDHQGPVERPADRRRDRPHPRRRRTRPPDHQTPCGRVLEGGDTAVEEKLYRPEHIEKIVAWGGLASVKHVTRYIQPGLEMIALDPKRSATIIGRQAFDDDETMREVARCAAVDIGVANQEGCANARVIYVMSGTDAAGIANANKLGEMIYEELTRLPSFISTPPLYPSLELYEHVEASRMTDDWYQVIGGEHREGAIIVSQFDSAVDYSAMLSGRVANIVPVDSIDKVTEAVTAYTQTIGIYPESLKHALRDTLPLFGAQRLTSLGYACSVPIAAPQDAIEPMRRMCKWIVEEACDPDVVTPLWRLGEPAAQA